MSLNPFVYSYKRYPNSKLATFVNQFCSGMQRLFIIFAIIIALSAFEVSNWGEALVASGVMFVLWLIIKHFKDKWSDKVAAKQESVDNPNNSEEK